MAYLLTGLLGGFGHCTGMCGPIVFGYTGMLKKTGSAVNLAYLYSKGFPGPLLLHLYYNLGRTTTYMFLGGLVSAGVSVVGLLRIQGLQHILMVTTGIMMVVAGLLTGGFVRIKKASLWNSLTDRLIRLLGRLRLQRSEGMLLPLGIIMGFLPCGLLYTVLIGVSRVAVDEKNTAIAILKGMSLMGIFGLSTSVALTLTGVVSNTLFMKSRKSLYRAAALIMVVLGVIFIWRRI